MSLIVIKVGGSLYALPDLAARLRTLLAGLEHRPVLLFPGGGAMADGVRQMDDCHGLGEEWAHWLALRALTVNAFFLHALLPDLPVALWPAQPDRAILEPYAFALADEKHAGHLPHTWEVTSDSLAARAARLLGAQQLLVLKAITIPDDMSWQAAAHAGFVDTFFPTALAQAPALKVRVVNMLGQTGF